MIDSLLRKIVVLLAVPVVFIATPTSTPDSWRQRAVSILINNSPATEDLASTVAAAEAIHVHGHQSIRPTVVLGRDSIVRKGEGVAILQLVLASRLVVQQAMWAEPV